MVNRYDSWDITVSNFEKISTQYNTNVMSYNKSNGNINFDINSHTNKFLFRKNNSIFANINSDSNNTVIQPTPYVDLSTYKSGTGGLNNVKLLIISNTTNNSTTFTDTTGNNTISADPDVIHSTDQFYIGTSSIYFNSDNSTKKCISIPYNSDLAFDNHPLSSVEDLMNPKKPAPWDHLTNDEDDEDIDIDIQEIISK